MGMEGGANVTLRARASIRSSAGSTSGECAASDTNSRCPKTLRRPKFSSKLSTAPVSPEITTLSGPLMAAIATRSRRGAIADSTYRSARIALPSCHPAVDSASAVHAGR